MNDNYLNMSDLFISRVMSEETSFLPIMIEEKNIDDSDKRKKLPNKLSILPLRNIVLFPGVILPINIGRKSSLDLVRKAYDNDSYIGAITQKDKNIDQPKAKDLYTIGVAAKVLKILEMPDGSISILMQGRNRIQVIGYETETPELIAKIKILKRDEKYVALKKNKKFKALISSVKDIATKIIRHSSHIPMEATFTIKNIEDPEYLVNFICSNIDIKIDGKQKLLEKNDIQKRAINLLGYLTTELQLVELKDDIQMKVKTSMEQQQREYMLQQQIKTIQNELGGNPLDDEIQTFRLKAKKKKWSKDIAQYMDKELIKLQRMSVSSSEYSVQVNYIESLLDLPWGTYTKDNFDLKLSQKILDKEHAGLENVKERIIEHLAVLKLKGNFKSPILCLYGPPGVGKTSLGKSIANALKRKYIRISLGGLHDEAEIRGHRKTYIGAMPGRIMHGIKKAKSSNPVFILDEIDKVGTGVHSDPSSALLEVLDPEQNVAFHDNYLEVDYDLSQVMFVATANTLNTIPLPLLDRMELINISGYIIEEKIEIAKKYLLPSQLFKHGLTKKQLEVPKEILGTIIKNYTRESGVRELDKSIAKLIRKIAKKIAIEEKYNKKIEVSELKEYLGANKYSQEKYQGNDIVGVVTGLAWTSVGGEILFIESSLSKGTGKLTLTGNLGDVMKESAILALEYIKSHSEQLAIDDKIFKKWNLHVHVPEGAIPKDGPSAGITMATSLASIYTQRKIKKNLAMTGEITLRGKVMPVGGIKEKILAAKRAGIKEIILSEENKKDIEEIKEIYLTGLKFHYVKEAMEVLDIALLKKKVTNPKILE